MNLLSLHPIVAPLPSTELQAAPGFQALSLVPPPSLLPRLWQAEGVMDEKNTSDNPANYRATYDTLSV